MFGASKSGSAAEKDPQFEYVVALLNGDGTNGAQNNTFIDLSTNNATITRFGNATQGSFTPYGNNWSNYFNGSSGYLSVANGVTNQMGSGDWTAEAWIYLNNYSLVNPAFAKGGSTTDWFLGTVSTTGKLYIGIGTTDYFTTTGPVVPLNTWCHVALVRSGTTLNTYLNGVLGNTLTGVSQNFASTGTLNIARGRDTSTNYLSGYVSNARLVKGTAVYTANFTPPTAPLTAITNTSLLTCQSNRFIDNSVNALTLTATGNPSVQKFSPFLPTTLPAYTVSNNGGSGYFDGNNDYCSTPSTVPLQLGTGDFTFEVWIYLNTATTGIDYRIFTAWGGTGNAYQFYLRAPSLRFIWQIYTQNSADVAALAITPFTWTHIAACRASGSIKTFINGVLADTATGTNTANGSATPTIGADAAGTTGFNGFISDLRLIKGTALYSSNFVPPTTPLTAITNTSLLFSAKNAGIYDSAMISDYETVGNAQVNTSVKKYGAGSMAFDGTLDSIQTINKNDINLGTGDFTLECWAYFNVVNAEMTLINKGWQTSGSVYASYLIWMTSAGSLQFNASSAGSSWDIANGKVIGAMTATTWTHIAVTRSGTTFRAFVNGVITSAFTFTSASSLANIATQTLYIGGVSNGGSSMNGYLDDVRITKGYARYVANFTPPGPLPTS